MEGSLPAQCHFTFYPHTHSGPVKRHAHCSEEFVLILCLFFLGQGEAAAGDSDDDNNMEEMIVVLMRLAIC
jgi:hypothetical protein